MGSYSYNADFHCVLGLCLNAAEIDRLAAGPEVVDLAVRREELFRNVLDHVPQGHVNR